jgi:hypothetical protein
MSEVPEEESGDHLDPSREATNITPGVLGAAPPLARPVTTVVLHDGKCTIYRDSNRMAFFPTWTEETKQGPNGMSWIEYRIPRFRWDATAAIQLLEGMSVQRVLGEQFALFEGRHSVAEDPVPAEYDALLVRVLTVAKGRSLLETLGTLFVAYRSQR